MMGTGYPHQNVVVDWFGDSRGLPLGEGTHRVQYNNQQKGKKKLLCSSPQSPLSLQIFPESWACPQLGCGWNFGSLVKHSGNDGRNQCMGRIISLKIDFSREDIVSNPNSPVCVIIGSVLY